MATVDGRWRPRMNSRPQFDFASPVSIIKRSLRVDMVCPCGLSGSHAKQG